MLMVHVEESNLEEIKKVCKTQKNIKTFVNLKNDNGYTALAMAAKIGDVKIMKELLRNGADPNSRNNASQSIVFTACSNNKLKALQLLVKNDADVNIPDQRGWTPLMIAANKNYSEIVQFLVESGADTRYTDKFGKSAFDRTSNSKIFFSIVSKSSANRLKEGMQIKDDSNFVPKQNSKALPKAVHFVSDDISKQYRTSTPRVSDQNKDYDVLDTAFRKNLRKLKKQYLNFGNKAIEDNVMNEMLDQKSQILDKLQTATNKMSKRLLNKLMDYINLKFRIALTKNKIDIDKKDFVNENDVLDIYHQLKLTKVKKNSSTKRKDFNQVANKKLGNYKYFNWSCLEENVKN